MPLIWEKSLHSLLQARMFPIQKASLCSDGGDLGPSFSVNRLTSDSEWITLPKAKDPLIFVILLPSFTWIKKLWLSKWRSSKMYHTQAWLKNKKPNNISLSSSNLQDSFDTKIDPPHEMQFGKTLNLILFFLRPCSCGGWEAETQLGFLISPGRSSKVIPIDSGGETNSYKVK